MSKQWYEDRDIRPSEAAQGIGGWRIYSFHSLPFS